MNLLLKLAGAAIAVVLVTAVSLTILAPAGGIGGPAPAPTATPTPSPTPADGSASFASDRYAYSLSVPAGWTPTRSVRDWTMARDQHDWLSQASDQFRAPGTSLLFTVFAAPIPAGMSSDAWIESYATPDTASTPPGSASPVPSASFAACAPMRVDLGTVSVDGHPATFLEESDAGDCGGTYALVPVGDQMYVFTVWLPNKESTLMTFLESVRFLS